MDCPEIDRLIANPIHGVMWMGLIYYWFIRASSSEFCAIGRDKLSPIKRQRVMEVLDVFTYIRPRKDLATLLFMSISFMNNIWAANDMLETQMSLAV